jgi:hypothetical protein
MTAQPARESRHCLTCFGGETLQKNNVRKLGNRGRISIASPRKLVDKIKEIT